MTNLSEAQQAELDAYPKTTLSQKEFDELPEYSMTNPTQSGPIGAKRWKRRTPVDASVEEAIWFLDTIEKDMYIFHHIVIN